MAKKTPQLRKQVAALPIARGAGGELLVLVATSRGTRRFIVPKGWPMKKRRDHEAAEIEALEEVGLIGRAHPKPIGCYSAWKRMEHGFVAVAVEVYPLEVLDRAETWKEQGQRTMAWLSVEEAGLLLDEPGLAGIVLSLAERLPPSFPLRPPVALESAPAP